MDLLQNPLHILNATTRDNRQKIMALAEERALFLDPNECTQARLDLIHPRKRLSAELAWLPGAEPEHASEALRYLESSPEMLFGIHALTRFKNILGVDRMIPIAQANLLAAGLSRLPDYSSDDVVGWIISEWIVEIAYVFENIDIEAVRTVIDEERIVPGFPAITDLSAVETEIQERRHYYRQVITLTLNNLPIKECARAVTRVVVAAANNEKNSRLTLVNDLVDWYEIYVQESLEKEEANIEVLDEEIRAAVNTEIQNLAVAQMINRFVQAVKNWDSFVQPIQINKKIQGLSHDASYRVAARVRRLAVDLFNKHDRLDFSQQLTNMLQEVFAEVDEIAEYLAEDARTLAEFAEQRKQRVKIEALIEKLRTAADGQSSDSILVPMVNQIIQAINNLDTASQSVEGHLIATSVRDLAVDLFNKHDKLDFARQLTYTLQRVFAGVDEIAEYLAEDARTLAEFAEQRKQRVKIEALIEKLRTAADGQSSDSILAPMVNQLVQDINNLGTVAQSVEGHLIAISVRDLAVDLFNKHDKLDFSRQLIHMLQGVFAEVSEVAERLAEDARTLNEIADQRTQALIERLHRRQETEQSGGSGCLVAFLIGIGLIVFIGMVNSC